MSSDSRGLEVTAHDGQGDEEHDGIEGHDTKNRANKAPVKATLFAQPAVGLRAVALNKNKSKR